MSRSSIPASPLVPTLGVPPVAPTPATPRPTARPQWLASYDRCNRPFLYVCVIALLLLPVGLSCMRLGGLFIQPENAGQRALAPAGSGAGAGPVIGRAAAEQRRGFWDSIKVWRWLDYKNPEVMHQAFYLAAVCFYAALWIVYFGSKPRLSTGDSLFRVQSLRKLLSLTSVNFSDQEISGAQNVDFEKIIHRKAASSQTSLGMLMAVAALELNFINNGLVANIAAAENYSYKWQEFTLSIAALGAILGLVAFIISVDSLDCLFNGFVDPLKSQQDLPFLFYRSTINWRYCGLVAILFVATLVVASRSPLYGATALTLIIGAGYHHWFPSFHVESKRGVLVMAPRSWNRLVLVGGMFAPMIVELIYHLLAK